MVVFTDFFVVFSVIYWMCGHLAVKAHNWVNSTDPVVSQSHQRGMCGWQTRTIIVWLFCNDLAPSVTKMASLVVVFFEKKKSRKRSASRRPMSLLSKKGPGSV